MELQQVERNPNLWRRLGVLGRRPDSSAATEALEADALLLREENARLRVKLETAPNVERVIERLRALPSQPPSPNGNGAAETNGNGVAEANGNGAGETNNNGAGESPDASHGEHAWQMLTQLLVMRNSLIHLCEEIGQVMSGLQTSLQSLSPPDYVGDAEAPNGTARNGLRSNGHLKEA
jgi:hypothetical protein